MKKIRNLSDLDRQIREYKQKEQKEKEVLKEGVSKAKSASEQIELAFYIGKIATEVFRTWNKPKGNSSSRCKNVIISILMITGIQLAQRYLNDSFNKSKED